MASFQERSDSAPQFGLPPMTPVVRALLISNFALGVAFLFLGGMQGALTLHRWLGLDVQAWRELAPFLPIWQLATYGFVHSTTSPMHLLGNMLGLYFFGTWIESLIGSRRFACVYALGLVAPALVQLAVSLPLQQPLLVVGASGAVLLLVVAMATLRPHATVIVLFFPVKLWVLATVYVALDLFGLVRGAGDAAHLVHLTGAALGFASAKLGWLWFDPFEAWRKRVEVKRVEEVQNDEQRLDRLLDQIHREGIGSLSARDREFLKRMSARRGG